MNQGGALPRRRLTAAADQWCLVSTCPPAHALRPSVHPACTKDQSAACTGGLERSPADSNEAIRAPAFPQLPPAGTRTREARQVSDDPVMNHTASSANDQAPEHERPARWWVKRLRRLRATI